MDDRYEMFKDLMDTWRVFDAVVLGRGMWRRRKRVEEARRMRERCLRGLRSAVKRYKGELASMAAIWETLRRRVIAGGKEERKRIGAWVVVDGIE